MKYDLDAVLRCRAVCFSNISRGKMWHHCCVLFRACTKLTGPKENKRKTPRARLCRYNARDKNISAHMSSCAVCRNTFNRRRLKQSSMTLSIVPAQRTTVDMHIYPIHHCPQNTYRRTHRSQASIDEKATVCAAVRKLSTQRKVIHTEYLYYVYVLHVISYPVVIENMENKNAANRHNISRISYLTIPPQH